MGKYSRRRRDLSLGRTQGKAVIPLLIIHLLNEPVASLFEAFRKAVKAFDLCVSEGFSSYTWLYEAETNFVGVVPQMSRLCLSLNMAFAEINDPRGLCRDMTGLGRWGNGDISVRLESLDDLPYILGLVRRFLEW